MNKYIILIISIFILTPALFADTGTTGTGTTGTGTTGTGTTGTGTTGTGTTGTGTTGTGTHCMTGVFQTNQEALMAAQKAFSVEITRLVTEKQTSYESAKTLTGTLKVEAIKNANIKFRAGFKLAIKTLNKAKIDNRGSRLEVRNCKKEERKDERKDKKEERKEIKSDIKSLKEKMKEIKKSQKNKKDHQ